MLGETSQYSVLPAALLCLLAGLGLSFQGSTSVISGIEGTEATHFHSWTSAPLNVTFSFVANGACNGGSASVPFESSVRGGIPPYNYTWNFGDGGALGYSADPTHTFANSFDGPYNVTLQARDATGTRATDSQQLQFVFPPCASRTIIGSAAGVPIWAIALVLALASLLTVAAVIVARRRRGRIR